MRKDTFIYQYNDQDIHYDVWYSPGTSYIETIVFLGIVQLGQLVKMTAELCPPGTAVVEGAQHWYAADDGHDIPNFVAGYVRDAFCAVSKGNKVKNVIAESQSASGLLKWLGSDSKVEVEKIVLVQPLGLNGGHFGSTPKKTVATLKRRIVSNGRHQLTELLSDPVLRYNHKRLVSAYIDNHTTNPAHYASGLAYDAAPDLHAIQNIYDIAIVCGEKDKLFPALEISENLQAHHITVPVDVVRGAPHSPLATKFGQKLLDRAFAIMSR
ncbi:MAG: hypothetical protein WAT17_00645 [Candidatus Saccharimonadales bacterium]